MNHRSKGLTLLLVLAVLALLAGGIVILTSVSNSLIFQTRGQSMECYQRNLQASAAAWVKYQQNRGRSDLIMGRSLDATALAVPAGEIAIQIMNQDSQKVTIGISTSCRRGKLTWTGTCNVSARP